MHACVQLRLLRKAAQLDPERFASLHEKQAAWMASHRASTSRAAEQSRWCLLTTQMQRGCHSRLGDRFQSPHRHALPLSLLELGPYQNFAPASDQVILLTARVANMHT